MAQRPNNPILLKPVSNYPTPVITDRIIIEYVPLEVGATENLAYGSLFDNATHTAFTESYPGFQLVYKAPALDENGWFERRTWCNPRIDQESYNYSITYAEGSTTHPTVTRAYVVKRSEYTPKPILTEDPDFPGAYLVDQKMVNETTPPEINSLYVTIVETYQTLPGPIVITQDFDPALNIMVTTSRQVVLATDEFDPTMELLTLALQESPITQATKLRIWSYLEELPETFTEYSTGKFNFPNLVFDITLEVLQLTLDPDRSQVRWFPVQKAAPQVPAIFQTTTSYYTSEPAVPAIFAIGTRDLVYNGISFGINMGGVLCDEITVQATFVDDSNYGDLDESHTFDATDPTATAYNALIGTYQTVAVDIKRYRGSIWILQSTAVLLL